MSVVQKLKEKYAPVVRKKASDKLFDIGLDRVPLGPTILNRLASENPQNILRPCPVDQPSSKTSEVAGHEISPTIAVEDCIMKENPLSSKNQEPCTSVESSSSKSTEMTIEVPNFSTAPNNLNYCTAVQQFNEELDVDKATNAPLPFKTPEIASTNTPGPSDTPAGYLTREEFDILAAKVDNLCRTEKPSTKPVVVAEESINYNDKTVNCASLGKMFPLESFCSHVTFFASYLGRFPGRQKSTMCAGSTMKKPKRLKPFRL